jgi:hypothetical protein
VPGTVALAVAVARALVVVAGVVMTAASGRSACDPEDLPASRGNVT